MTRDETIEQIMAGCDCSYVEAEATLDWDEAIDHGDRLDWEPTLEEEYQMKQAGRPKADRKKRDAAAKVKNHPADDNKKRVIEILYNALTGALLDTEITMTNPEKTIDFLLDDAEFTITLTKHRPKTVK